MDKEKLAKATEELLNAILALRSYGFKTRDLYVSMDYKTLLILGQYLIEPLSRDLVVGDENPFDNAMIFGVKIIPSTDPWTIRVFNFRTDHIIEIRL